MKKNIFKFAYIALAVVSMIALSQRSAYADLGSCGTAEGTCLSGCNPNGSPQCYTDCQNVYVSCVNRQLPGQ